MQNHTPPDSISSRLRLCVSHVTTTYWDKKDQTQTVHSTGAASVKTPLGDVAPVRQTTALIVGHEPTPTPDSPIWTLDSFFFCGPRSRELLRGSAPSFRVRLLRELETSFRSFILGLRSPQNSSVLSHTSLCMHPPYMATWTWIPVCTDSIIFLRTTWERGTCLPHAWPFLKVRDCLRATPLAPRPAPSSAPPFCPPRSAVAPSWLPPPSLPPCPST